VVTGPVCRGGDTPPPHSGDNPTQGAFCHLLGRLARGLSLELKERLVKDGWSVEELLKCACS
jgi:hypothetical protein